MSKAKVKTAKAETLSNVDELSLATPFTEGTDSDNLPFAEWSDQDINFEKWDTGPIGKDKNVNQPRVLFEDDQEVHLPPSIAVNEWKRCSDVFSNVSFVVFVNRPTYPDLVTPNKHLLRSEFYRSFISSIETLLYIGSSKPFPEEYGSSAFNAQNDRAWRPWHHIYSNCKISKGQTEHTPVYNPAGKYIVRLFWLGTWKKIYVDDLLPVDTLNNLLIPSLYTPKINSEIILSEKPKGKPGGASKKESVELWPLLLCKALLKIASLSWNRKNELNDFDIIQCLTGWIPQKVSGRDISSNDIWDIFMAYVDRFAWDSKDTKDDSVAERTGSSKSKAKDKKEKNAKKEALPRNIEVVRDIDHYVVASCNNFGEFFKNEEGVLQNEHNDIFIGQVRDVPLVKPPPRPELEFWKTFRYEEWATERGIIPPDITKLNLKALKIANPFKRLLSEFEDTYEPVNPPLELENTDKRSEKSSKSSKVPKAKVRSKNRLEPDPTMWIDFSEIHSLISYITIYFQPRSFKTKVKIADINFSNKTTEFRHIISPYTLKESRNEPVYIFLDSIDYKVLVVNLSQEGNVNILKKDIEHPEDNVSDVSNQDQDQDICINIILRKTTARHLSSISQRSLKSFKTDNFNTKPINCLIEEYFWESNGFGACKGYVHTVGSKSLVLDLKPGRNSFRLWIYSHSSYVLQLFSDTAMTVGCLEEYLLACTVESQLLTNLCYELSSSYGKLVQSFGMLDHSISLRNVYSCYKPTEHLTKKELITVHNAMFEEFCKIVVENTSAANAIKCIQLLFFQLKTFDYINPYIEEPHLYPENFSEEIEVNYAKRMERAAVKIQAFFKGVYIRLLLQKMEERHKEYLGIFETLKKVYAEVFSSDKRLSYCPTLLRLFFERKDILFLTEKFELYKDLQSVLSIQEFKNAFQLQNASCWIPMCRYEFFINSLEPIFVKINLFCNIKNFYVRVFDNDTQQEIKRFTNNVSVQQYHSNINGYTILCYGWTEDSNIKVNSKLKIVTKKMARNDLLIVPSYIMTTTTLRNNYIPNYDNAIFRYIVKAYSDSFLTAHLTTSYENARLHLKLLDKKGNIIQEAYGLGSALLPVVRLHHQDNLTFHTETSQQSLNIDKPNIGSATNTLDRNLNHRQSSEISDVGDMHRKMTYHSDNVEGSEEGKHHKKHISNNDHVDSDIASVKSGRKKTVKKPDKFSPRSPPHLGYGSQLKIKSRSRVNESLVKVNEHYEIDYILEGKLIGDSWPLSEEEWKLVQRLREKSYLNLTEERNTPKKSLSLRKASAAFRDNLGKPFWVLDLVHASGDSLQFVEDCDKKEKRDKIKREWFENNIERYKKAIELRNSYLQEHTVLVDVEEVEQKETRSNNPEYFSQKKIEIPTFDELMLKPIIEVDEDSCKVKTNDDYQIGENLIKKTVEDSKEEIAVLENQISEFLKEQSENIAVLSNWFSDVRNDSAEVLDYAINLKKEYLIKMLETKTKGKTEKKEKGSKKSKK